MYIREYKALDAVSRTGSVFCIRVAKSFENLTFLCNPSIIFKDYVELEAVVFGTRLSDSESFG